MSGKKLKTGFSTSTAAAAGAKAALLALLGGENIAKITLELPGKNSVSIPIESIERLAENQACANVIKDAGDDPDVTNKALIKTTVTLASGQEKTSVLFKGGKGVGRITLPGLSLAVGEPAINPGPRRMIKKAVLATWEQKRKTKDPVTIEVMISVPQGEKLAPKTLNPRLGIKGGISILGTTGLVKPFSHEAYTATISKACDVALAQGVKEIVLTTGGKSEKLAMKMRPQLVNQAFVQIADFFAFALQRAESKGFRKVGLVCFFGKAVKQAQGLAYTHAHKAPMDLKWLADLLAENKAPKKLTDQIAIANTARHALDIIRAENRLDLVELVGAETMASARVFLGPYADLWVKVIDFDGSVLFSGQDKGVIACVV